MFALSSARSLRVLSAVGGLFALASVSLAGLASAETPAHLAVSSQRPIADEPSIDAELTPHVHEVLAPTPAPVAARASQAAAPVAESEPEFQIASVGSLAMRPLPLKFDPIWPTRGEITTYFGEVGPYSPHGHSGLDVAADSGTPIVAMDGGEVIKAYWDDSGYGGLVIMSHPSGYETWYGHLSRLGVNKGDQVKRGEQIGGMGSTGYSTGSHLHFEIRQDGQVLDPLKFLRESALLPALSS